MTDVKPAIASLRDVKPTLEELNERPTDTLSFQVQRPDEPENKTTFVVKRNVRMIKVMRLWSQKYGQATHTLRFMFNGGHINTSDTPESIGLEDGDMIEVMLESHGGRGLM